MLNHQRTNGIKITKIVREATQQWIEGKIGIQQFMNMTGTNNSSSYSTIARSVRDAHKHIRNVNIV